MSCYLISRPNVGYNRLVASRVSPDMRGRLCSRSNIKTTAVYWTPCFKGQRINVYDSRRALNLMFLLSAAFSAAAPAI